MYIFSGMLGIKIAGLFNLQMLRCCLANNLYLDDTIPKQDRTILSAIQVSNPNFESNNFVGFSIPMFLPF